MALIFAFSSIAQKKKVNVILKNGTVIKGKIVPADSQDKIKVESKKNTWVFPKNEVDKVVIREEKKRNEGREIALPWFFKADGGLLTGNSGNEEKTIRYFHGTANYGVTNKLYAGAGMGVEYYLEQTFIPAFANFMYKLSETNFSSFLFMKTGYIFPGDKQQPSDLYDSEESRNLAPKYLKASGGVMFHPGIGLSLMASRSLGFSLAAGYRHHELNYSGKDKYELEQRYNRLTFSLSIIFK